jgi:hypothetical protein
MLWYILQVQKLIFILYLYLHSYFIDPSSIIQQIEHEIGHGGFVAVNLCPSDKKKTIL